MSVTEQRYKAVQGVLADGPTVGEVAGQWSVSPRTMHRWLSRYEAAGLEGGRVEHLRLYLRRRAGGGQPSGGSYTCSNSTLVMTTTGGVQTTTWTKA